MCNWGGEDKMNHVFIVGSKGIPAQYGGFETFVEELTKGKQSQDIMYHVSHHCSCTKRGT